MSYYQVDEPRSRCAPRCFARACGPARSRSAWGAAAPRRFAPLRGLAPSPGGLRPGSRGRKGPTRAACSRGLRPLRTAVVRGCGPGLRPSAFPARFLRHSAPCRAGAPAPALGRSGRAAPARAPRCAFPPLPRSAACAPLRGSAGARWPRAACRPIRSAAGFLRAPLLLSGPSVRLPWPRGGSLAPPPGQGSRFAPPRPPCGPAGRFPPSGGPGLGLLRAAACGRLLRLAGGAAVVGGFSPAPPRPAAPAGGSGEREAHSGWLRPPLRGSRFSRPSCGPPSRCARAPRGVSPRLTVRKLSTQVFRPPPCLPFYRPRQGFPSARCLGLVAQARGLDPAAAGFSAAGGLTFPARCAILFVRGPLRSFGGRPCGVSVHGIKAAQLKSWAAFFLLRASLQPCRKCTPLLRPPPYCYSIIGRSRLA